MAKYLMALLGAHMSSAHAFGKLKLRPWTEAGPRRSLIMGTTPASRQAAMVSRISAQRCCSRKSRWLTRSCAILSPTSAALRALLGKSLCHRGLKEPSSKFQESPSRSLEELRVHAHDAALSHPGHCALHLRVRRLLRQAQLSAAHPHGSRAHQDHLGRSSWVSVGGSTNAHMYQALVLLHLSQTLHSMRPHMNEQMRMPTNP